MNKQLFGETVRSRRIELKKSQLSGALEIGVSLEAYRKWEKGLSLPKEDNYKKLCDFLETEEIMGY